MGLPKSQRFFKVLNTVKLLPPSFHRLSQPGPKFPPLEFPMQNLLGSFRIKLDHGFIKYYGDSQVHVSKNSVEVTELLGGSSQC